ncbi:hypothetical protein N7466_008328 [Penicillium verhagenii]|uniref:uncharacterized protein n=1 Tax=Penicillium verhagenii TaxID=1562060 RepID=UPI0025458D88|nr:uncharacterized protein N7466_008328 [Penicillium verhagenii]KAJ5924141.1 hypothetical protein N7466_008328 [Penicillium verhagenii]
MDEANIHLSRYGAFPSMTPKFDSPDVFNTPEVPAVPVLSKPFEPKQQIHSWYDPRGWSRFKRTLVLSGVGIIVLIIAVIVGTIYGIKANRYPKYTPLNYRLVDKYEGESFFDNFRYFTDEDPTHGFVVYVNQQTAQDLNLTYATETSAVLRVDSLTPNALAGRNSVRVESTSTYDNGLFIFDIIHTPYGCGTWPALWLTDGYNWPNNGEIDILETTNEGSHGNDITLHTTGGCSMDVKRKHTGYSVFSNCDTSNGNAGCGVVGDPITYGEAFNAIGGGVYALELRDDGVRAWFFPRNSIPGDIADPLQMPDPSTWGTALADFPGTECNIASHFRNQSIIANIDLCGELGAQPQFYEKMYKCPGTCPDFVANNPSSFEEAYWEFASFSVYQA